jgi:hypothetical protein
VATVGIAQITPPLPIKKGRSHWDRLFHFRFLTTVPVEAARAVS